MDDFELELKQDFLTESEDLLSSAESAFLSLEQRRNDPELLNEIFRLAHNLKGTAKAVGFEQLSGLTHIAENLILKIKEGEIAVQDHVVSTLLRFNDKVTEIVAGLKEDVNAQFDLKEIESDLQGCLENNSSEVSEVTTESSSSAAEASEAFDAQLETSSDSTTLDEGGKTDAEIMAAFDAAMGNSDESIAVVAEGVPPADAPGFVDMDTPATDAVAQSTDHSEGPQVAAQSPASPPKPQAAPAAEAKAPPKRAAAEDESIRVSLGRIDQLNNIIGELVILHTILGQRRYEYIKDELSNKSIGQMGKLFKEAQMISMSLRMLPLKATFQKMARIVRDTSRETGKDIEFDIKGDDTEVDKTVLESLGDPLVHIVRNAVDHGIESNEKRKEAGKGSGKVAIRAFHEGSNLVIEVTDDGGGINPEVIRRKAIEKGILNANSKLNEEEIIQLIFHPGFSTKEQVTAISGRGVGMDVVKTNIEGIGGSVKVTSVIGKGSKFKIALPLTLAIIEGFVIRANEETFVVPLTQVFELTKISRSKIQEFTGTARVFELRGEVIPLFYMNQKLGQKVKPKETEIVIVVRGLDHVFGVVVDDVRNQQQIVIKELGDDIKGQVGLIGSAIMGDGRACFIVDLFEIFKDECKANKGFRKNIEHNVGAA